MTVPAVLVQPTRFWNSDDDTATSSAEAQNDNASPLVAEEVFAQQDALLARTLRHVAPGTPGVPHLYFVGVAPDGEQDVFLKEARYAAHLFDTRFGTAQRSVILSNNRSSLQELPLASATNLRRTLETIGHRMNHDSDILFLFLTSHGSRDAELAVQLEDLSFLPLSADSIAAMLRDAGIRWKVIVISACYSGSFIDALKDDHSMIITAARADRTSFGCSDDAEFTYFGRAYLQQALTQTTSFTDAFNIARKQVSSWETREHEEHSDPQIVSTPLIEAKLAQWRSTLAPAAADTARAADTKASAGAVRTCSQAQNCANAGSMRAH